MVTDDEQMGAVLVNGGQTAHAVAALADYPDGGCFHHSSEPDPDHRPVVDDHRRGGLPLARHASDGTGPYRYIPLPAD